MHIQIREFLDHAGIEEQIYPGKKLLVKCPQPGEFKSHCVEIDWKNPKLLHLEIKAGLSGHTLKPADLKNYPVSFQARTYLEIATGQDNREKEKEKEKEEDEEGSSSSGRGGGGGRKPKIKKLSESGGTFHRVVEGKVPELGEITKMVVMGKEVAKEAYGRVMEKLAEQIRHMKVATTDLMAEAGKFVTRYSPPAFMKARGDEDVRYRYDREKNEIMFGGSTPS